MGMAPLSDSWPHAYESDIAELHKGEGSKSRERERNLFDGFSNPGIQLFRIQ